MKIFNLILFWFFISLNATANTCSDSDISAFLNNTCELIGQTEFSNYKEQTNKIDEKLVFDKCGLTGVSILQEEWPHKIIHHPFIKENVGRPTGYLFDRSGKMFVTDYFQSMKAISMDKSISTHSSKNIISTADFDKVYYLKKCHSLDNVSLVAMLSFERSPEDELFSPFVIQLDRSLIATNEFKKLKNSKSEIEFAKNTIELISKLPLKSTAKKTGLSEAVIRESLFTAENMLSYTDKAYKNALSTNPQMRDLDLLGITISSFSSSLQQSTVFRTATASQSLKDLVVQTEKKMNELNDKIKLMGAQQSDRNTVLEKYVSIKISNSELILILLLGLVLSVLVTLFLKK